MTNFRKETARYFADEFKNIIGSVRQFQMEKTEENDIYSNYKISISKPLMAGELLLKFVKIFDMNILYALQCDQGKVYYLSLFSNPIHNRMTMVTFNSELYGIVDIIFVRVYDSMELMLDDVNRQWVKSLGICGKMLEGIHTQSELLKYFV